MKIKYYGTGAAEGVPALYCSCDVCRYSIQHGGRNLRTRSQALINGRLLMDMPPDTLYHYQHLGLPICDIKHVLITHKHADHLHPHTINIRSAGFVKEELSPLNIYGSMPTIDLIFDELRKGGVLDRGKWNLNELSPFKEVTIDGFSVIPFKANHAFETYPYIYDISDGEKRLLYCHDSGVFLDETLEHMKNISPYYNLVSLDCTMGISDSTGHKHMNLDNCIETANKFISLGYADKNTIFVLNHFSHNGSVTYDSLLPLAESNGFIVAYDGMEIEF